MVGNPRRAGTQPQKHRRRPAAPSPGLRDRRVRFGQVDAGAGCAPCRPAQAAGQADRGAGQTSRPARLRAYRQRGDGGPDADRQDDALQPGQLCRRLRCDPQAVRAGAAGQGARLHAGHLQLQLRQQRHLGPLPDLRRQGLRARRDAVPLRRLPALPRLRRPPLPRRGAGGRTARQKHRRCAGADDQRGGGLLRGAPRGAGAPAAAGRRRPGVPAPRPAGADALRRRGAAPETGGPPGGSGRDTVIPAQAGIQQR